MCSISSTPPVRRFEAIDHPTQTLPTALTNAYVLPTNRIPDIFQKIRDGQAPERFTTQLLRDWDFKSTNDRAFIALLKALGFLSSDGVPTQRYHDYRDHSKSQQILGQGIRETYGDLFLIKAQPTTADRAAIEGKFKSFHNASDNVAGLMAKTFLALLPLANLDAKNVGPTAPAEQKSLDTPTVPPASVAASATAGIPSLN